MNHRLTERLTIGGAPTADDLQALAAAGYRSIIDLRSDGEPRPQSRAPWDEAKLARAAGLTYRQISVEPQLLGDAMALAVRHAVADAPAPVFLHCTTGRRAGTFGLLVLAVQNDLTIDDCLARGHALGLDFDSMPRLTKFLRDYLARATALRRRIDSE